MDVAFGGLRASIFFIHQRSQERLELAVSADDLAVGQGHLELGDTGTTFLIAAARPVNVSIIN